MSLNRRIALAALICLAASFRARGTEIHACVHKNTGAVRILVGAGTCDPANETPLNWSTGGSPGALRVLDANDALVGPLVDFDHVVRLIDGHWFAPTVNKNGFVETGLFYLYESTDCTGQPYVEFNDRIPEWGGSSLGGGSSLTIYYAAPPITPRTIQSSRSAFSSGPPQPCLGPLGFAGVPVGIPVSSTIPATPPFRLVE
jgi:hypothetical protein